MNIDYRIKKVTRFKILEKSSKILLKKILSGLSDLKLKGKVRNN